jgi:hypothetical protein
MARYTKSFSPVVAQERVDFAARERDDLDSRERMPRATIAPENASKRVLNAAREDRAGERVERVRHAAREDRAVERVERVLHAACEDRAGECVERVLRARERVETCKQIPSNAIQQSHR